MYTDTDKIDNVRKLCNLVRVVDDVNCEAA